MVSVNHPIWIPGFWFPKDVGQYQMNDDARVGGIQLASLGHVGESWGVVLEAVSE